MQQVTALGSCCQMTYVEESGRVICSKYTSDYMPTYKIRTRHRDKSGTIWKAESWKDANTPEEAAKSVFDKLSSEKKDFRKLDVEVFDGGKMIYEKSFLLD